jgi:hypothetical protein
MLLTLNVADLVAHSDEDRFHFGYSIIEPSPINLMDLSIINKAELAILDINYFGISRFPFITQ